MRIALLVPICPLGFAFLASDFGGVDEAVLDGPFWGPVFVLVVSDVLRRWGSVYL